MQTTVSSLFLKEETPTGLRLESPSKRWLFLISVLFLLALPTLLLFETIQSGRDQMVGIVMFSIAFWVCLSFLFFVAFRSQVSIHSATSQIVLLREYWIGFGALGRKREKILKFEDVTNIYMSSHGLIKIINIEINGKKDFIIGFSPRKKEDAQRFYDVFQSWHKGLTPDTGEAEAALDEIKSEATIVNSLKSAEKMLYFFGAISLISRGMDLVTAWAAEQNQFL